MFERVKKFFKQFIAPVKDRSHRVINYLLCFIVLNLFDFILTSAYMENLGLVEANPIARFIIHQFEAVGLFLFKLITTLTVVTILFCFRELTIAEIFSIVALVVYVILTLIWFGHIYHAYTHVHY